MLCVIVVISAFNVKLMLGNEMFHGYMLYVQRVHNNCCGHFLAALAVLHLQQCSAPLHFSRLPWRFPLDLCVLQRDDLP